MKKPTLLVVASALAVLVVANGACVTSPSSSADAETQAARLRDTNAMAKRHSAFVTRNQRKADAAVECARLNQQPCPAPIMPLPTN